MSSYEQVVDRMIRLGVSYSQLQKFRIPSSPTPALHVKTIPNTGSTTGQTSNVCSAENPKAHFFSFQRHKRYPGSLVVTHLSRQCFLYQQLDKKGLLTLSLLLESIGGTFAGRLTVNNGETWTTSDHPVLFWRIPVPMTYRSWLLTRTWYTN